MLNRKLNYFLSILFLSSLSVSNAYANNDGLLTFTWENDIFSGSDGQYSNGIGIAYTTALQGSFNTNNTPEFIVNLIKDTEFANAIGKQRRTSYYLGQSMYTPNDITKSDLIEDDRPYAGILILGMNLNTFDSQSADRWGLQLGIVGPASMADSTQKAFHRITHSVVPQGWSNQLHNEAVFRIEREKIYRPFVLNINQNTGMDFLGSAMVGVGNLKSDVNVGISIRLGSGLSSSYPSFSSYPVRNPNPLLGRSKYWQVFINYTESYVFNDITVDGNTFRDSHSVTLINNQDFKMLGVTYGFETWNLMLSYQTSSKSFKNDANENSYGAFSISTNF